MKGNYLVLDANGINTFNQRYIFTLSELGVLAQAKGYDRITVHPFDKPFQAIAMVNNRKVTLKITPSAMNIWKKPEYNAKYTLVEIQNTINELIVKSQTITENDIIKELN